MFTICIERCIEYLRKLDEFYLCTKRLIELRMLDKVKKSIMQNACIFLKCI